METPLVDELEMVWPESGWMAGSFGDGKGHYCAVGAFQSWFGISLWDTFNLYCLRTGLDVPTVVNDLEGRMAALESLRVVERCLRREGKL